MVSEEQGKRLSGDASAIAGLLISAVSWGVIWYPYRWLDSVGITGLMATMLTYAIAMLIGFPWYVRRLSSIRPHWFIWSVLAIGAGLTNTAFVLAVIHGEVMRVVLLFYLAPLWTVIFARLLLGERLSGVGYLIMLLSLAGAFVMLSHPDGRWPLPNNGSEWLGLLAGICFAFSNVWARRAEGLCLEAKALSIWVGCTALPLLGMLAMGEKFSLLGHVHSLVWSELCSVALAMFAATLLMQYSLTKVAANRAIVILLFELVASALTAWWLAGEYLIGKEWLGAAMIMAATVFSGRLEQS